MAAVLFRPQQLHRLLPRRRLLPTRSVHIHATPSTTSITGIVDVTPQTLAIPKLSATGPFPAEIQFEVLGAPYSLLSVALPASSTLHTRRGTLLGLSGAASATSTLSVLPPLSRAVQRIPFLYQKLSAPSPLTALISTNVPNTTFCVLALDGSTQWTLHRPDALLAWSGAALVVKPRTVAGRGLVALVGRGQVYQVSLAAGEEFSLHPKSLLAYAAQGKKPEGYKLPAMVLQLQVPRAVVAKVTEIEWVKALLASRAWELGKRAVWALKMAVWGERQLLRFSGPATVLLQSRTGGRIRDLLRREEVSEYADIEPPRSSQAAPLGGGLETERQAEKSVERVVVENEVAKAVKTIPGSSGYTGSLKKVIVSTDGKVEFQDSDFKEFQR